MQSELRNNMDVNLIQLELKENFEIKLLKQTPSFGCQDRINFTNYKII